ncbi:MAG: cbb3-type cytochrome c oxidase subunit I [Xanthobacteraceae bacterium]|nr:cbb3-type cytochrome c oxidase subunit I [Xanthobacteraceae bacterium]
MTDTTLEFAPAAEPLEKNYLNEETTLWSWLTTTDHKRIGILYTLSITFFFFIGGLAIGVVRLELMTPHADIVSAEAYNRLFSLHGIIMVWFFLVPSIPTTLGNFLVPMMIGAHDVAFPRLNLLSWYLFMLGALFTLYVLIAGGVDTGWTFYTPLSTSYATGHVAAAAAGVFVAGFSTIATGVNFVATIHMLRAPGMTWFRLPLFVWSMYAVSLVMLLATPVLAMTLLLIFAERVFGMPVFDPAQGGDPLLFQHLFWFYSHPAVYIMILPAMGVVSEIFTCFARRRIFGYTFMVYALLAIAVVGFMVWGHHMFVAGQSALADLVFSFLSFIVAVPSAIKVFNWTATLYRGQISFEAPMLYAMGFLALFTLGGLTGLHLASVPLDIHLHDTYFVIAHFHFIMVGGTVSAFLGGIHYWWPKFTGRMYPESWARFAAITMSIGFITTFLPQYVMGYAGMPRRYQIYLPQFQIYHVISSVGAMILAVAYIMPLLYLGWSLLYGRRAGSNPWGATGLEWQTSSPPPKENFHGTPRVVEGPYVYHDAETASGSEQAAPRPQGAHR